MKDREAITSCGKAAFYASIYDDLRKAAMDCGWSLGIHGSLANDMDLMAMPWTEEAVPPEVLIRNLGNCFADNPFKDMYEIPFTGKCNNRVVYTLPIWADYYLDISMIYPFEEG